MNALDRKAGEIIAEYLNGLDPRVVWRVGPATSGQVLAPFPGASETPDGPDRLATPAEGAERRAA